MRRAIENAAQARDGALGVELIGAVGRANAIEFKGLTDITNVYAVKENEAATA